MAEIRRRLSVLLLLVPLAVAPAALAKPLAVRAAIQSSVSVDVSRLRTLGLGPTADLIGQVLADELGSAARPDRRILVRVTGLSMNSFAGAESSGGGGGGDGGGGGGAGENDYMEGEVLLLGPDGAVLRSDPIVMSLPSSSGGAYYREDAERRRVIELSRNFARWAKHGLG